MSRICGVCLQEIGQTGHILCDDVMLMSRSSDSSCVYSENVSYGMSGVSSDIISSGVFDDVTSMAYQESCMYSLTGHDHDGVYCNSTILPSLVDGVKIAEFVCFLSDDKIITPVYFPYTVVYEDDSPYVGEIKFIASGQRRDVDIDSPDFDGYVYADGSMYSSSRFPMASKQFGSDERYFRVPRLCCFFAGTDVQNDVFDGVKYQNPLRRHSHNISYDLRERFVTGNFSLYKTIGNGSVKAKSMHIITRGKLLTDAMRLKFRVAELVFPNGHVVGKSDDDIEYTVPSHQVVQAMVYIGR